MTRQVPVDKPLSDEDREYLHARGYHDTVEMIDANHGKAGDENAGVDLFEDDEKPYEEWTKTELDEEIKVRNSAPGRPADKRLAGSGTNAEKAARLRADDEWLDSQA